MKTCALLAFFLLSMPLSAAEEKVLHIYTWFDFLPRSIIERFQNETGIKVIIDHYDNNQTLEANLLTKTSGYDLVFPTAWPYLYRQIKKNLYRPLDKSKLPNWKYLDPALMAKIEKADPGHIYAVPYIWGITALGYNKKMIEEIMPNAPLDSWALIFDPEVVSKFAKNGVYLLDDATDVFSAALVYLGLPPFTRDREQLKQAYNLLVKVRPYIKRFDNYRSITDLANGEACISMNWSGDVVVARERALEAKNGVDIGLAIPKEGVAFWMDVVAMPVDAAHPDNAHRFLNFIMTPEIAAGITNEMKFANANAAAFSLVDKELTSDPAVYPPSDVIEKSFVDEAYDPDFQREMNRLLIKLIMNRE